MLVDNVIVFFKGDNQTVRTSHGRVLASDGEFYDGVDVPDDAYDRERIFF